MKNKPIKKLLSCFILSLILVTPFSALAEGGTEITKTAEFTTTNSDFYYEFDEKIEKDGQVYKLDNVEYEELSSKGKENKNTITKTKKYKNLLTKKCDAEETITVAKDGEKVVLNLASVEYEPTTITNRTTEVKATTDFEYSTTKPNADNTKEVKYEDKLSGQTVTAEIPLISLERTGEEKWVSDVEVPITCKQYDADYYLLGDDILIPYNETTPALNGFEKDILSILGLDSSSYKLTSFSWNGKPYTKDGVKYRNAVAKGQRLSAKYKATYKGEIDLPDCDGWIGIATYEGSTTEISETDKYYTVKATAHYKLVVEEQDNTSLYVAIGVGLLLLIIAVVLILFFMAKKKKKKQEELQRW